jgi:hypothetical protein
MKTFSLQTLEQLIYDIELYLTKNTDTDIIEKLNRITDFFATIVRELEMDYYLQDSVTTFGDKRKKE